MNTLNKTEEEKMREAFEAQYETRKPSNGVNQFKRYDVHPGDEYWYSDVQEAWEWFKRSAAIAHANFQHSNILEDYDRIARVAEKQAEELEELKSKFDMNLMIIGNNKFVLEQREEQLSAANAAIAMFRDAAVSYFDSNGRDISKLIAAMRNTQAAADAFMSEHDAKMLESVTYSTVDEIRARIASLRASANKIRKDE